MKNRGEHDDLLPARTSDERARGAHPEIGSAGHDVVDSIDVGPAFTNLDFEPRFTIKTLLKGCIVTGELELMVQFELQRHPVECLRRCRGQGQNGNQEAAAKQG